MDNNKIGIFGFGVEGESLVRYFLKHPRGELTVFDEREILSEREEFLAQNKVKFVGGPFNEAACSEIEIAYRSPGLKREKIREVLPRDAQISSQTNLFFAEHRGIIVGVTGTKGKSTTVGLLGEILKQNNAKYFVGGNIGNPPLDFIDETTDDSTSILELSSFQLEDLEYAPDVAIYLPIYLDHLDFHENQGGSFNYHENKDDYFAAKAKLVEKMTDHGLIIAYNQECSKKIIEKSFGNKVFYSEHSLGVGCSIHGKNIVCHIGNKEGGYKNVAELAREKKIPLPNLLAAFTFAFAENYKVDLRKLFENYLKLPLRIELAGEADGVKYFNDSAATNPISTIEAMKTMDTDYVLIAGGSSKNLTFEELAGRVMAEKNLRKVYLFGQTAEEIKRELKKVGFGREIIMKNNLQDIISEIAQDHRGFSAVLFSPASASFDQFKNYKDRGETFDRLIKGL